EVSSSSKQVSSCQREAYAAAAASAVRTCGSRTSVTRVKVSELALPSSLSTVYSMTRTVIPGIPAGSAPVRRIRREAAGPATRDRHVPSARTSRTGRSISDLARHSTWIPAARTSCSRPWDRKLRSASSRSPGESLPSSRRGQRLLPGGQARHGRAHHGPGAAFPEAHHADLRERAAALVVARIAELGGVLAGVGQVQPHPGDERALGLLPGLRPGYLLQQRGHHMPAQPPARVGDRRRGRLHAQRHAHPEPLCPLQARDQLVPHLAIAGLEEQHHRQQVVHPTRAGSARLRCSRAPACSTTRSTSSGGNPLAITPIPIRSASRSPATTRCPGLAMPMTLHRCDLNLTPLAVTRPRLKLMRK